MIWIFRWFFSLNGWKFHSQIPNGLRSFVMIGAPHTSNFDFIPGIGVCVHMKRNAKFVIKSEWMRFPMNLILGPAGAVALDRSQLGKAGHESNIDSMAHMFQEYDELVLLLAAEGTRKPVKKWKSGWYYIAQKANVPVVLGYLDHKTKTAGLGPVLEITGDYQKDIQKVAAFYAQFEGYHPENFLLPE